jgi:hypothetical protein
VHSSVPDKTQKQKHGSKQATEHIIMTDSRGEIKQEDCILDVDGGLNAGATMGVPHYLIDGSSLKTSSLKIDSVDLDVAEGLRATQMDDSESVEATGVNSEATADFDVDMQVTGEALNALIAGYLAEIEVLLERVLTRYCDVCVCV